jgi:hypothetical protein
MITVREPASLTRRTNSRSSSQESRSSMPMRHFTVTGTATAARIAATHSATSAGSAIRQAPKRPDCTRSEGAAHVEVDLAVAPLLADARALGELARIRAAELQRNRVLAGVEIEQSRAVPRGRSPHW